MLPEMHQPAELRERFQVWLDPYQPNRLKEINVLEAGYLLELLSQCDGVLPAKYCDQLDIPKGSTYADAVADLRKWHAKRQSSDGDEFIGHDTWWCDGMPVTPRMRREVLSFVAEMIDERGDNYYQWIWHEESGPFCRSGQVVLTEKSPIHLTVSEFLGELTGEADRMDGFLPSHIDDLGDWLQHDFLPGAWGISSANDPMELDDDFDGDWKAYCQLIEWIESMKCQDVCDWASRQPHQQEAR